MVVGVAELLFPGESRGRAARDPREERRSGDVVRLCYDETDIFQPELLLGGGLGIWEEGMRILWRWPSTVCNSNGILGKRPPARCEPHASTSKGRGYNGREGGVPGSNCQFAAAAGATRDWRAGLAAAARGMCRWTRGRHGAGSGPGGACCSAWLAAGSLTAPKKGAAADWWTQRDVFPILAPALRATRRFGRQLSGRFRTTQGPLKAVVTRKAHCPEGRSREGGGSFPSSFFEGRYGYLQVPFWGVGFAAQTVGDWRLQRLVPLLWWPIKTPGDSVPQASRHATGWTACLGLGQNFRACHLSVRTTQPQWSASREGGKEDGKRKKKASRPGCGAEQ